MTKTVKDVICMTTPSAHEHNISAPFPKSTAVGSAGKKRKENDKKVALLGHHHSRKHSVSQWTCSKHLL